MKHYLFLLCLWITQGVRGQSTYIKFDDTRPAVWPSDFELVGIPSSLDEKIQKAFFYATRSAQLRPLVISLHTWSGNYEQKDELALLCQQKDVNYIHPDFRGANRTASACCSELALADIDDAITFALQHARVDPSMIYVIGVSGGGYAALSSFMKSKHRIHTFSAWVPITDLEAWYNESTQLKNKYAADILACTHSSDTLNRLTARQRSPLYMQGKDRKDSQLFIYAGIHDGIKGSVPITHSIHFYNKVLKDQAVQDSAAYVSDREIKQLLKYRKPLGNLGKIADRAICLRKSHDTVHLTLFDGDHEMLSQYALDELLTTHK